MGLGTVTEAKSLNRGSKCGNYYMEVNILTYKNHVSLPGSVGKDDLSNPVFLSKASLSLTRLTNFKEFSASEVVRKFVVYACSILLQTCQQSRLTVYS